MKLAEKKHSFGGFFGLFLLFAVMFQGCSTLGIADSSSYLENQYKALAVAQETYNAFWGGFKMLYDTRTKDDEGKLIVNQEDYDKGLEIAMAYYDAWQLWIDAVKEFDVGKMDNQTIEQKAEAFRVISVRFINLLAPYIND